MSPITTLDPSNDARHHLADKPNARESLALVVSIPEEQIGFLVYTWVNDKSEAGGSLSLFGPGTGREEPIFEIVDGVPVGDMGFDDWKVGPVHIRQTEALQTAHIAFNGEAASVDYTFEAMHPAYNYNSHPDGTPWYVADDRFEQSGYVKGTITLDGRTIPFDLTGHRDHSWGTRNWGAMQHWKWVWAQTPEGDAVHALEIFGLGKRQVFGYVFKGGEMAEITELNNGAATYDPQMIHTSYAATITDDLSRTTEMTYAAHSSFVFPVTPFCRMNEVGCAATIDGVAGPGHVEMGWPLDYLDRARADEGLQAHLAGEKALA